eukprot:TRINITY_DN1414_c0_g1_i3.p1 TRINITY_DN1414_c0_g1~~TRINITY_DN1414_c0_g1_i3.p1  ORF type:complete len:123 (-),score=3.27 TRINITY_DN1414_c0_g1_i3:243-611(-)
MSTAALRKELASFKSKYSLAKPLKGKKGASTAGVSKAMSKGQKARKKRQEKKQREAEGYLDNTPYHKLTPVGMYSLIVYCLLIEFRVLVSFHIWTCLGVSSHRVTCVGGPQAFCVRRRLGRL